jgi:hypothetical protein
VARNAIAIAMDYFPARPEWRLAIPAYRIEIE